MSKIEHNGIELELDLMDADVMEKFEDGLTKTAEDVKEKSQYLGKKNAECMRIQCCHVNRFFDSVFGPGTADKLFGKKNNLEDHMTAFGKAANMVGQVKERTKEITSQYAPERVPLEFLQHVVLQRHRLPQQHQLRNPQRSVRPGLRNRINL